jgi:hypothetical protein
MTCETMDLHLNEGLYYRNFVQAEARSQIKKPLSQDLVALEMCELAFSVNSQTRHDPDMYISIREVEKKWGIKRVMVPKRKEATPPPPRFPKSNSFHHTMRMEPDSVGQGDRADLD